MTKAPKSYALIYQQWGNETLVIRGEVDEISVEMSNPSGHVLAFDPLTLCPVPRTSATLRFAAGVEVSMVSSYGWKTRLKHWFKAFPFSR